MTALARRCTSPTLATLGMQWLVLIVIALGMIVSSIGITSSHGLAVMAASHESELPSDENPHGHVHADQGIEFAQADERSGGAHPHHGMDHSHDTPHHLLFAWGAPLPQLRSWELMVRPWIEMGQAYRLYRPPMG